MTNQNLKAYLIYNQKGYLVGGPIVQPSAPRKNGRRFVEIPYSICCDDVPVIPIITAPKQLKAFVRYTEQGIIVRGFVKKGYSKPNDGHTYVEFPINLCCYYTTTTSSTTTTTTTVATTTTSSTTTTTTTV